MEGAQTFDRAGAESLVRWWRDAGVDVLVDEQPRDWLARAAVTSKPSALARSPSRDPAPAPSALPTTLPELLAWMRDGSDVPEAGWGRTRLLPSGDPAADVMVLVDLPEPGDAEAGRLLSGDVGDLFDRMLHAIGRSRETIWLSPIATARALGRISEEAASRLVEIARHQIALVRPRRLLIMGERPNAALIGPDWQRRRGDYHSLTFGDHTVEAVGTFHPTLLNNSPSYKKEAWKDLQLLVKGLS